MKYWMRVSWNGDRLDPFGIAFGLIPNAIFYIYDKKGAPMDNQVTYDSRPKPVRPLPSLRDIDHLRSMIRPNVRDLLLFDIAVETGITARQLLNLKVRDLKGLKVGDPLAFSSGELDRKETAILGPKSHRTFKRYLRERNPKLDDFLFKSRKGSHPLSISSASRMVSSWYKNAGLKGLSGLLSLRKTWELYYKPLSKTKKEDRQVATSRYKVNSIRAQTVQELVYKELEHAIVTARIKPGERLVTEELARQMGISRIPIREAIGRLEARNFLTVQPKKGTLVNELSERKLKEILEIRLLLELSAARKAALAATKDTVESIEQLNSRYVFAQKENDADRALSANREFHFTIYRGANMPLLLSMIQDLWDKVSPYYHLMFRQTLFHDPHTGSAYHQKIIDGMAENDPHKVSRWLKVDLSESTDFVMNIIRSMKTQEEDR